MLRQLAAGSTLPRATRQALVLAPGGALLWAPARGFGFRTNPQLQSGSRQKLQTHQTRQLPPSQCPRQFHSSRALRTTDELKPKDKLSFKERMAVKWKDNLPLLQSYSLMGGVGLAFYLVVKTGVGAVDLISSLDTRILGEVAFFTGMLTAGVLGGVGAAATRMLTLRPEPVYKFTLNRILSNPAVKEQLGEDLRPGAFRAYSYAPGSLRSLESLRKYAFWEKAPITPDTQNMETTSEGNNAASFGWLKYYRPRRLQLVLQVHGSRGHGMASAEVERTFRGEYRYNSLSVSLLDSNKRIILDGDASRVVFQNVIKLR